MTPLESGSRVGQYVLGREIGRGAMAIVYEATHAELGKRVALKAMHPHLAADETASLRFLREGKAAAQIHSAHVVDVFDVGTQNGVPYLVMELLGGTDLGAYLRERRKLSVREIAEIMLPVCSAVHAAHEVGVIHRDLKPSNIMLATREGGEVAPTILDFGISKVETDQARDLTASETLLGTVAYMSPEQTRGARTASSRSDQYSLGVILFECSTGAKPFAGATPYALMHAIVSTHVAAPSALDPSRPAAFDDVVLRAMHRDPAKRFPSVRALGAALVPFAGEEARQRWAAALGGDRAEPASIRGGHRARTMLIVAAIGAGAALVLGSMLSRSTTMPTASSAPMTTAAVPSGQVSISVPSAVATSAQSPVAAASSISSPSSAIPTAAPTRTAVPTAPPRRAPPPVAAPSAPELGTNGAPIVE